MGNLERLQRVPGLTPEDLCLTLMGLARKVEASQAIVEVGVYQARSLCYLTHGARTGNGAHVYGVDPWDLPGERVPYGSNPEKQQKRVVQFTDPQTHQKAVANVRAQGMRSYVTLIKALSLDAARDWRGPSIGLLHIDGDHHYQSVLDDFHAWRPHLAEGATVVFDDYRHTHPEVIQAVDKLAADGAITGLDIFHDRLAVSFLGAGATDSETKDGRDVTARKQEESHV